MGDKFLHCQEANESREWLGLALLRLSLWASHLLNSNPFDLLVHGILGNNKLKVFRACPPKCYGCARMPNYSTQKSYETQIISVLLGRL